MPRGRSKKITAVEPELLPPEDNQPLQQVRQVKHKTEWVETLPVEETPDDDAEEIEDIEIEGRSRRKRNKNAIQELRKRLRAQGVTPTSNLRLYIERYIHSETDAGGSWAETEFCTKYSTTEEHIFNKDYIDAARKWGAGRYRITIRMDNRIADAFDEVISAPPASPVIQNVNPNDPNSPQVIVQSTNGDGQQQTFQPMSMKDMMKAQRESLKEELEFRRLLMESYGMAPNQQGSSSDNRSEEEIIASAIVKQPAVIESVVESIVKSVARKGGGDSSDAPWFADIIKDSITSGQLAPTVQALVKGLFPNGLFGGFSNLFGGQNNGQAQMGAQTVSPMANTQGANPQESRPALPTVSEGERVGPVQETMGNVQGYENQATGQQQITPTDQALNTLLSDCRMKLPPEIAYGKLMDFADAVYDQAPAYSIYPYIKYLGDTPTDQVIEFVKALPGGEQVVALPHCREWCEGLQKLIQENQEGGEE